MNCIDLFAGAGGLSLAAHRSGLRVRLAIERDKSAVATYRANLCRGDDPPVVLEGDIAAMRPSEIFDLAFGPGEICDLLLGGPPCQGFSTHRLNDSGVGDERNGLVNVYFAFVRQFRPTAFLMENVPGMLWPRHARHLDAMQHQARDAGYHLFEPVVIDARDFGVPQRRKRVIILGLEKSVVRDDFTWPPEPTHVRPTGDGVPPGRLPWLNCEAVFAAAPTGDPNDVHMKHRADLVAAFARTPTDGGSRGASGRVLECHRGHDGHSDVYGRIDRRQPAPTMTTACINPSKGRFVHPTLNHGITARQAARIQTFPDDYVFHGGLMAAGQQIGNAVPVKLGVALIAHVVALLEATGRRRAGTRRNECVVA
ncbi:DNA cytosine methyltransferase [Methylobacterium oryzihabitans]|uniref:Cytosine-specific methyltransferase n=1 Tax=Methylobacterium oryzihabitans TaxID=2499852 RepID=A0A3S2V1V8_9HYPH|nr:DNA cytosine methyltransferase [Methylobacterium oryzihabitans]RVU13185.1 DNA cytosine methyltransferase [Methylobacterium oryzihabitans]